MFVICPHCHTRDLPTQNGFCPSCRKDMSDTRGVDPHMTSMVIRETMTLPPFCHSCSSPTDRYVSVSEKVETGQGHLLTKPLSVFLGAILAIFGILAPQLLLQPQSTPPQIVVKIPQCHNCTKKGQARPLYIDLSKGEMTFLVHTGFRDRVATNNMFAR